MPGESVTLHISVAPMSCSLFPPQRGKLIEIVDHYHFSGQPFRGRSDAAAKRGQHDLLRRLRRLPWKLRQLSHLDPTRPMRHGDFLPIE